MNPILHQSWPEPVVPVQSLSASGCTAIPARYVRPPSQRPLLSSTSTSTTSTLSIPVIDLASLVANGNDPVENDETVRTISEACREWGFFHVVNHGVSPDLVRRAREVWKEFFDLPMEEKRKYANSPATYEGYGSRLGVAKGAILDWGDYFFLNLLPDSAKNKHKWPTLPTSCRETVEEYGGEVVALCWTLMKVLSVSLGLEVGYLQKAFGDECGACLRANFYPKCPQPDLTLGVAPHSDPGGLTILLADEHVKGLQVRKGDEWITVHPVPGAFIINLGDQIQVLSNAIYKSVEHRVVVNSSGDRTSLALFFNPRSDVLVGPCPELVSADRPPLYEAMTFDEYRLFLRTRGLFGKQQVESLKANGS